MARIHASMHGLGRVLAIAVLASSLACGGGGGGGGGNGGSDDGGVGIGADGVTIFWWRHGQPDFAGGTCARPTIDGGFVLTGFVFQGQSFDPDGTDALLVKTDAQGRKQWQKRLDGAGWMDSAHDVRETADGGFVLACERRAGPFAAPSLADCWLLKTDANGELQWQTVHGGAGEDVALSIVETPGGFAAVGEIGGNGALMLLDATGHLVSERSYGGAMRDRIQAVARLASGGYALAGVDGGTPAEPVARVWVLETDASGDVVWEHTYGEGAAYSVQPLPGGGFAVAGEAPSELGDLDLIVLAIDANGDELWRRTFGGGEDDWGRSLAVALDGALVVAGTTRSFSTGSETFLREEVHLVRLDPQGNTVWQQVKGMSPDSSEGADSVVALPDGSFLLAGHAGAEALIARMDRNGRTVGLGTTDFTLEIPDVPQGIIRFSNATALARAAAGALFALREIGPFGLEILVQVLEGRPTGGFCDTGAFAIEPDPVPLELGVPYQFQFADCVLQPAPDLLQVHGTFAVTVEALSGSLTSPPYDVDLRYEVTGIDVVDDVGALSLSGWTSYSRSAGASGEVSDLTTALPGDWLWLTEQGIARRLTTFDLESSLGAGLARIGPAAATLEDPLASGPLSVRIEAASQLQGVHPDDPQSGSVALSAEDGSRLALVATGGGKVRIDIDTDADGTTDLSLSTTWEALD